MPFRSLFGPFLWLLRHLEQGIENEEVRVLKGKFWIWDDFWVFFEQFGGEMC